MSARGALRPSCVSGGQAGPPAGRVHEETGGAAGRPAPAGGSAFGFFAFFFERRAAFAPLRPFGRFFFTGEFHTAFGFRFETAFFVREMAHRRRAGGRDRVRAVFAGRFRAVPAAVAAARHADGRRAVFAACGRQLRRRGGGFRRRLLRLVDGVMLGAVLGGRVLAPAARAARGRVAGMCGPRGGRRGQAPAQKKGGEQGERPEEPARLGRVRVGACHHRFSDPARIHRPGGPPEGPGRWPNGRTAGGPGAPAMVRARTGESFPAHGRTDVPSEARRSFLCSSRPGGASPCP